MFSFPWIFLPFGIYFCQSASVCTTLWKKILVWLLHGPKGTIAFSFPFPFLAAKNITGLGGELKGHILGSSECSWGGKAVINNTLEDYVLGEKGCPCLKGPVGRKGRRWGIFHLWRPWLLGKNSMSAKETGLGALKARVKLKSCGSDVKM